MRPLPETTLLLYPQVTQTPHSPPVQVLLSIILALIYTVG